VLVDEDGFPVRPGGSLIRQSQCSAAQLKTYREAKALKEAKETTELETAVAEFNASPLADNEGYARVVAQAQSWADRGGKMGIDRRQSGNATHAAIAAKWIRRLLITEKMRYKKGAQGLLPGQVRLLIKQTPPYLAEVESAPKSQAAPPPTGGDSSSDDDASVVLTKTTASSRKARMAARKANHA